MERLNNDSIAYQDAFFFYVAGLIKLWAIATRSGGGQKEKSFT